MNDPADFRKQEMAWLRAHREEYRGQWVVIEGDKLIAHGDRAIIVYGVARDLGIRSPFLIHIPDEEPLPWGGW